MKRSFLAPEYHQVSVMDCGVGALSCFLRGYGLDPSYERLREACQTSVDGTSIEALESIAVGLGIDVLQHLIPPDLLSEGLEGRWPSIAVVSRLGQPPHFVTLWRQLGRQRLQLMDPARGRSWETFSELQRDLYSARLRFAEDAWRDWFVTSSFCEAVQRRAETLLTRPAATALRARLLEPSTTSEIAAIDAALRLVAKACVASPGKNAAWRTALFEEAEKTARTDPSALPSSLWSLQPLQDGGLEVRSAVVLAVADGGWQPSEPIKEVRKVGDSSTRVLRQEDEQQSNVWRDLYGLLTPAAKVVLIVSSLTTVAASLATAWEILFARAASFDGTMMFPVASSRAGAAAVVIVLFVLLTFLEGGLAVASRATGRQLEVKLRQLTFFLLPRADDTFVRSRPTGDLAHRANGLELGRQFPTVVFSTSRALADLVITAAALTWIHRSNLPILFVGSLLLLGLSLVTRSRFRDIDTRFQAHGSRLLSVFLDALRGFRPVRLHGFQAAFRAEQEQELLLWHHTGTMQAHARAGVQAAQSFLTIVWMGALFWNEISLDHDARTFAVVAFWSLRLPSTVGQLITQSQSYTPAKNAFIRLLEIVRYTHTSDQAATATEESPPRAARGMSFELRDVSVVVGGTVLLENVNVQVPAGQHVAVVGASGSGKSTLLSLVLGFHPLASGELRFDGRPLSAAITSEVRRDTAWVDPAIQIWNGSFLENLEYAGAGVEHRDLLQTLEASDLLGVLDGMDRGLDTPVGGDGQLLSGGEGQRLRLGRALLRKDVRMALFDEAFRGLDRDTRKRLTLRARLALQQATMLFVSHDISHALDFDRVLVVDKGRIIEDGHPLELAATRSHFRALLDAERDILTGTWAPNQWRRIRVAGGRLQDDDHA
jgi:ABC-type bacteriocin/lantibiotic exporter with double-glycine peptidase domain